MSASARDQTEFGAQIEPYRRELQVHCYRMIGSVQDAEDMTQETFLRAWRRRQTLTQAASLKSWLYAIATNVCLDQLKKRPKRMVPATRGEVGTLAEPLPQAIAEPIWLEPYPDRLLLAANEANPEELITAREDISMAFIVALHLLPPRQRAVLLLRDTLDWSASEVATLLGTTVSAVKSALHRARAVLAERRVALDVEYDRPLDSAMQKQLAAYLAAWEAADIPTLVSLMKDDATFSMPPIPAWYQGREMVRDLVSRTIFSGDAQGRWRLRPIRANGQPGFALYRATETPGQYRAYGIQVVTLADHAISDVITFLNPALFPYFGLPAMLSAIPA